MKPTFLLPFFGAVLAAPATKPGLPHAGDVLPGRFIVQLAPGASPESIQAHHHQVRHLLRRKRDETGSDGPAGVDRVFSFGDFHSYSADLDDITASELAQLPEVLSIEPDIVVVLEPTTAPELSARRRRDVTTQTAAPWHLGDISHQEAGATEYVYDDKAGEGTTIYVLDTGIRSSHIDFEDRVRFGINGVTKSTTPPAPDSIDTEGHGTHVASIAAGKTHGVAKKAQLVDCKCFDGSSVRIPEAPDVLCRVRADLSL